MCRNSHVSVRDETWRENEGKTLGVGEKQRAGLFQEKKKRVGVIPTLFLCFLRKFLVWFGTYFV